MEEQLVLLLKESILNISAKDNNILEKYYKLFDEKKYIGSNFELIYKDMREVYSLDINSLSYGYDVEKEQIIYKELVHAIIQTKDKKNKIKLIPLIVYLDIQNILYYHLDSIDFFLDFIELKDYFVNTVRESGVKIDLEDIPKNHWERESYEKYLLGLKNSKFNKVYSFVEAYERGMGYRFDNYYDFLVSITYRLFFDDLVSIINNKKDTLEIIYLIHTLSIEEILTLARYSNNMLLKFEAIRKSVYFKTNNTSCLNLLKNEQEMLSKIILEFSEDTYLWQEFLDFYLIYPLRNPQLFNSLSKTIDLLEKDKIDMLIKSVKIDRYISDDSKEALSSCFLRIENDEIQEYCLELLYLIWSKFIDESDDYFGGIVLTDIIDIVIVYVRDFVDKSIINKDVKEIIYKLDEIDNRWFKDSSERNNYFYKQMSKLFVYGFAFEKYEMSELKDRVKEICGSNIELQIEYKHDEKSTLQLFNEYVLKEGDIK